MNELIVALYDLVALAGVLFLAYVIRQAMNDPHLKRVDPPTIKKARKNTFFAAAAFLSFTVCFQDYWLIHPSVIAVGLVTSGLIAGAIAILMVSLISMKRRAPPEIPNGHFKFNINKGWAHIMTNHRHSDAP